MSWTAYDTLAPYYVQYTDTRAAYCGAVDRLILACRPTQAQAMLDVGSGDGSRAVRLAEAMSVPRLVLSDPSSSMAELCRVRQAAEVWPCAAERLPAGPGEFDVITCLWNVLGAIEPASARSEALVRMRARLAPGGRIFVDVHNRYNASAAGARRVLARIVRDLVRPSEANGLVHFDWTVGGARIPSHGYLFTDAEMRQLMAGAGLRCVHQAFVHYDTGAATGRWAGQMLFVLAPD